MQPKGLDKNEKALRDAFIGSSQARKLSVLSGILTDTEKEKVLHTPRNKEPGPSQFKLEIVGFFEKTYQAAYFELLDACIGLALIPGLLRAVDIETRCFNEMLKAAEGSVTKRSTPVTESTGPGLILSTSIYAHHREGDALW